MRLGLDSKAVKKRVAPDKLRKLRRVRVWTCIGVIFCALCVLSCRILDQVRPIVLEMAQNRAGDIMVYVINDAVCEEVREIEKGYCDFADFEKDENNRITAARIDTVQINAVKADILKRIQKKMEAYDTIEVHVPLGAIFDLELLPALGPKIRFEMISTGFFNADVTSSLTSAGINQTMHEINVTVTAELGVISPLGSSTGSVTATVPVVHSLISGEVPSGYVGNWDTLKGE